MRENSLNLINVLLKEEDWIKSSELAIKMNLSVRSIKNYVNEINEDYEGAIQSSKKGYIINRECAKKILKDLKVSAPDSPKERLNYIIKKITNCKSDSNFIDLYDLSEELYVSYETIKKDLSKVKKIIEVYNLEIKTQKNRISLVGEEKSKRELLGSILYEEYNNNVLNIEFIKKTFPNYDYDSLKKILVEACKEYNYTINEYALVDLIISVMITMDRIKENFSYKIGDGNSSSFGFREQELSLDIIGNIETQYNIKFNEQEIEQFKCMLIGYLLQADYKLINEANLNKFINEEYIDVINTLIKELEKYHFIEINNSDFIVRFALHIKNLIIRLKTMNCTRNPLSEQIKTSCPLIFDCAVDICYKLEKLIGFPVNDDEIAFIALHIGSALKHEKIEEDKINTLLLFPQYYDFASKLLEQLKNEYSKDISISRVITSLDEVKDLSAYDLIISTTPISANMNKEYIIINPFLWTKDKIIISNKIEKINLSKKKNQLKNQLLQISNRKFFDKNINFNNEEDAIKYMTNKMHEEGYVEENFYKNVLEREKMSSTAFNYIAIPHGIKANCLKTTMYILLNDKPINWKENYVNIVILFAINHEDLKVFHDVFDNLITLLLEKNNANLVLKSNSYEECIENIIRCL